MTIKKRSKVKIYTNHRRTTCSVFYQKYKQIIFYINQLESFNRALITYPRILFPNISHLHTFKINHRYMFRNLFSISLTHSVPSSLFLFLFQTSKIPHAYQLDDLSKTLCRIPEFETRHVNLSRITGIPRFSINPRHPSKLQSSNFQILLRRSYIFYLCLLKYK